MNKTPNTLQMTTHARWRAQQRAISTESIEFVLDHGEWFHDRNGSMTAWMSIRASASLPKELAQTGRDCESVAVTVSAEGSIITVQRVAHQKRDWRGAR